MQEKLNKKLIFVFSNLREKPLGQKRGTQNTVRTMAAKTKVCVIFTQLCCHAISWKTITLSFITTKPD